MQVFGDVYFQPTGQLKRNCAAISWHM